MNAFRLMTVCRNVLIVWEVITVHVTNILKLTQLIGGSVLVSGSFLRTKNIAIHCLCECQQVRTYFPGKLFSFRQEMCSLTTYAYQITLNGNKSVCVIKRKSWWLSSLAIATS